jgi:hypothetical protein
MQINARVNLPQRQHREPEGRGHELMQTWALYRRDSDRAGAPRVSGGGWSEPLDKASDTEPPWLVLVDHALAPIYRADAAYERMVKIYYLDNRALWEVSERVQRTEGFVALSLRGICDHVASRVKC